MTEQEYLTAIAAEHAAYAAATGPLWAAHNREMARVPAKLRRRPGYMRGMREAYLARLAPLYDAHQERLSELVSALLNEQ
jgi:hypothetical protein